MVESACPISVASIKAVFCASLGYIAEILKTADSEYDVIVIDMSLGYRHRYSKERIENSRPDLVGISMMSNGYEERKY